MAVDGLERVEEQQVTPMESNVFSAHVDAGCPLMDEMELMAADAVGDGTQIALAALARRIVGYGYGHAAEDIERLLENMAQGRINEAMEEELSEELQREADSIRYGNAHRNIHVTVHRMAQVDQTLVDSYSSVAPQLLLLSKRLQRSVSPILHDKRQGGKQTGLYVGKRLNQHAFHRDDGRIFCNTRLPTEPINLAVALLIDESGSMCGSDRITRARATAIVVQDFCEKLGIPIMITGHTASNSHVELFSYAEFLSLFYAIGHYRTAHALSAGGRAYRIACIAYMTASSDIVRVKYVQSVHLAVFITRNSHVSVGLLSRFKLYALI